MEVRQGCHNSKTHHNSSKRNNFGIRIHTKEVQNRNKRLRCIKVGDRYILIINERLNQNGKELTK